MDYRAITSTTSLQWSCLYEDGNFELSNGNIVNDDGILKTHDGYIAVAMGSYFGDIGSKFRITTDDGNVFNVIKVEAKSDAHTDSNNIVCLSNGSIIEFVVDLDNLKSNYSSWWNFNEIDGYSGSIIKIEKVY